MEKQDNPIRIAQIIGKWVGGGVEAVVMNYYRFIDHKKIQFDFICDDDSTNIPYEEIERLGGKVILIPRYQQIFKYHKELKKILQQGNYKIVHSHINALSVFSLFAAKSAKVPVRIAHSHSTTNKKEWKKNIIKQILVPFSKIFATHYFACTEHAAKWLFGNKTFNNGEVFVLNNAIDLKRFEYNKNIRNKKRNELNITEDTLVIGNIGRFVQQKNHNFLIEIFKEIYIKNNNSILLLVGQGPLEDEIKNKVEMLGLKENVRFLGQRLDVDELYQAFDTFLLPSLYEGLGMVYVEAQAAGLYSFASTEVPSIAKVTENMEFISLDEAPEKWAEILLNKYGVKNRNGYRETIANNGFDIEVEVKKLEEKYIKYNYN